MSLSSSEVHISVVMEPKQFLTQQFQNIWNRSLFFKFSPTWSKKLLNKLTDIFIYYIGVIPFHQNSN